MSKTFKDITNSKLKLAVEKASSYRDVCKKLNVKYVGPSYRNIRNRILSLNLDTSHFTPFARYGNSNANNNKLKIPLKDILIKDSTYLTSRLRKRLIKENILKEKCSICGQNNIWNNKPISLQLDHINGISDDNELKNLRLLCPNCHSQTETFCSKNKRK